MSYAPNPGTRGYIRVVARGCGGTYDEWNGEYDCSHAYPWTCDDCPIVAESQKTIERGREIFFAKLALPE